MQKRAVFRGVSVAVLAAATGVLSACGAEAGYEEPVVIIVAPTEALPPADLHADVRIAVAAHEDLDVDDILAGCEMWSQLDVTCAIATDPANANLYVYVNDNPCVPNDATGSISLAVAYGNRTIEVFTRCYGRDLAGGIDRLQLIGTMGHEVGHQIGVWDHVPLDCAEPHLLHPGDLPVCGAALMNPAYNSNVHALTFSDVLAFNLRNTSMSVLDGGGTGFSLTGTASHDALCTYVTR